MKNENGGWFDPIHQILETVIFPYGFGVCVIWLVFHPQLVHADKSISGQVAGVGVFGAGWLTRHLSQTLRDKWNRRRPRV